MNRPRVVLLAAVAMVAFAANSVLVRLALTSSSTGPATFASIRVASGAFTLCVLAAFTGSGLAKIRRPDIVSAVALVLYLLPFTFAYVELSTGTGALILFACVQVTMLLAAVKRGERPSRWQWLGVVLAMLGMVYLVLPGVTSPSVFGAVWMAIAGIAWAIYSLRGAGASKPILTTARNFVWATPLVLMVTLLQSAPLSGTGVGIALAIASGALASGVGYAIWYAVLRQVSATNAAAMQLTVPALAAGFGTVFLGEPLSARLALSASVILAGVALVVLPMDRLPFGRSRRSHLGRR